MPGSRGCGKTRFEALKSTQFACGRTWNQRLANVGESHFGPSGGVRSLSSPAPHSKLGHYRPLQCRVVTISLRDGIRRVHAARTALLFATLPKREYIDAGVEVG